MRKIFIFVILLSILLTHIYENRSDSLLHKYINYALKHDDVVFETDIKDVNYFCFFGSVYSTHHIKPDLLEIKAKYTPLIAFRIHTNRLGEGSSAAIIVKKNGSLHTTYLSGYNFELTKNVKLKESRCIPTKSLHYKIKNKILYVTP